MTALDFIGSDLKRMHAMLNNAIADLSPEQLELLQLRLRKLVEKKADAPRIRPRPRARSASEAARTAPRRRAPPWARSRAPRSGRRGRRSPRCPAST